MSGAFEIARLDVYALEPPIDDLSGSVALHESFTR